MTRRQKPSGPVDRTPGRQTARIRQHDKRRQIFVLGSKPVTKPRAHARKTVHGETSVHLEGRGRVIVAVREHGVHEADVIHAAGKMRQKTADPGAAFAVTAELIRALHDAARLAEEAEIFAFAFQCFAVKFFEIRFVVERIDVADAAAAKDLDNSFGFWRKMNAARSIGSSGLFLVQQPRQSDAADATGAVGEEMAAREKRGLIGHKRIRLS